MREWLGRLKYVVATVGVILAAAATFIANLDKVGATLANWLAPWLKAQTTIEIVLDGSVKQPLILAIAEGTKLIDTQMVAPNSTVTFVVSPNSRYAMVWNGTGIKAETAGDILAPKTKTRWRLLVKGKEAATEADILALRLDGSEQEQKKTETTATVLASVAASQSLQDPASRPPTSNLLPEFDRAMLVVGLFETGTTDCHRVVYTQIVVSVGCLGFGIPGFLAEILKQIDTEDAAAIDRFFGEDAAMLRETLAEANPMGKMRAFLSTPQNRTRLTAALRRLTAWPMFRHHYQAKALQTYGEAIQLAAALDLRSERGVLMVFDNVIFFGRGRVNRQIARMKELPPPSEPLSEAAKLARYANTLKSSSGLSPALAGFAQRRVDLIVSGRAAFKGIAYDLTALGIRDDVPQLETR